MCVLDDVCATMHAVSEGADATLLEVWYLFKQGCMISYMYKIQILRPVMN